MKKMLVISLCALFALAPSYSAAEDGQEGGSADVVVKAELKIKIEAEKPEIEIETDINDVAGQVVKAEDNFLSLSPSDIKNVRESLPRTVSEERTEYRPEVSLFEQPPVFKISTKMPDNIQIEKWLFKVTDPTGATVQKQNGDGNLPDEIVWDGFDNGGRPLKLEAPYMYILTYMDKAGVPGTSMRKTPKIVSAFKYKADGKLVLEVSSKMLFEKKRKERLSAEGKKIIREIQDYMKMSNNFPVTVRVEAEDKDLASEQARSIINVLERELKLPRKFFQAEPAADRSTPRNYRTVFLIKT